MAALTKTVDGTPLPADQFAYVGDPQDIGSWHLPIDKKHIGSALEMFGHEKHVPPGKKTEVARKIAAKAKEAGLDTSDFEKNYCGTEHADFGNGWVEIFRAGDYGDKGNFDESDLDRVIANYDPDLHEAPACIGHPKDNAPAYGWASRLMRSGKTLLAKFKEVDPAFESAVKAGRFKKRSAAFYLGSDGKIAGLRHVGFLGAQPPEVKGLKNLSFDDAGQQFTAVDFGEEEPVAAETEKTIREQISAFFAEMFGKKEGAPATFSESDVKRIAREAVEAAATPLQAKVTELEGRLAQQSTQFSEREKKIATSETEQRVVEAVNGLKAKGRWIPAFEKMGLSLIFGELAKSQATIEFGEAGSDGKKPQVAPLAVLVGFMEALPQIVPPGTTFTGAARTSGRTLQFNESRGVRADANSLALNEAAEKRAKEKNIDFAEALAQVARENPELTVPGNGAAGAV